MNASRMRVRVAVILYAAVLGNPLAWTQGPSPTKHPETKERERVALSHALPKLNGAHLKATVVEVHYGSGESSPPHSHACAVIGYVVEGALRTQVKGEPETISKAGEGFYEAPNGIHVVSANASQTDAATFICVFRRRSPHAIQQLCAENRKARRKVIMGKAQLAAAEISQRRATTTSVTVNWERLGVLYARLALGAAFLSGIASRFGLYGKNVGYGNFANFVKYTAEVNSFMPAFSIPFLAWSATAAELVLGIALILGVWPRWVALESAASGALRHHHGHLLRDQVSAGLFSFLGVGRSRVTCSVRRPQTRT